MTKHEDAVHNVFLLLDQVVLHSQYEWYLVPVKSIRDQANTFFPEKGGVE